MEQEIFVAGAEVVDFDLPEPPYNPLNRPAISYRKPALCGGVYLAALLAVLLWWPSGWPVRGWMVMLAVTGLAAVLLAKRTAVWLVHLYQNKASDETRLKCVFEPSCSEYMLLAIDKYGVCKGVCKGAGRLCRCHRPNGGKDYP